MRGCGRFGPRPGGPADTTHERGYLTLEGQRAAVAERLDGIRAGQAASWVLTHGDDVVGRVNLNTIVRGIFRSASVGYWIDRDHVGRGLATAAVGYVCDAALDLGLHRVQAGTYPDNVGSQTVLLRNGFTLIGPAPAYLFLAGEWRDHLLYQRVLTTARRWSADPASGPPGDRRTAARAGVAGQAAVRSTGP